MGAVSHKCERYESEWSKCGNKKKRVREESVNHNIINVHVIWTTTLWYCGFSIGLQDSYVFALVSTWLLEI